MISYVLSAEQIAHEQSGGIFMNHSKYEVLKTVEGNFGPITKSIANGLVQGEAVNLAKKESENEEVQIFVQYLRPSDGQKWYLNRDGSCKLTGKAW